MENNLLEKEADAINRTKPHKGWTHKKVAILVVLCLLLGGNCRGQLELYFYA